MEWKTVKLGEVCKIFTGKKDVNQTIKDGLYPFFSCAPTPYRSNDFIYDGNVILVAGNGSFTGRVSYYSGKFDLYQRTYACVPIIEDIDFIYLYFYMKALFEPQYMGGTRGSSIPYIVRGDLSNFEISLPPLETQRRIAAILSSLDDKIENNNRINRNLGAQAQALFKSWFVDFEPWGGKMPEDWREGTLEDICTQLKEKVGDRDDVKVLSPVTTGRLMLSEEYFSKQVFSQSIAKYIVVPPTAFAYNPARVNIGSLGMNEFDFDGCVSPVYVVFECKEGYEYFFDLFRRTNQFKEEVKSRAIGGVRQTLGYDDFKRIQAVIPPKEIVDEFNKIYTAMLDVSDSNKRENTRLAALHDTLLPKLMKGEIVL